MNTLTVSMSNAAGTIPGFAAAFILAPGQAAKIEPPDVRAARVEARVKEAHGSTDRLREHPLVAGYRAFHAAINVRPSSASTPIKQAIRVFDRGYKPINFVVDTAMEIEYASLCSFQVYDLESIADDLRYTFASGAEIIQDRAHGGGSAKVRRGELLLMDERGVINAPSIGNDTSRIMVPTSAQVLVRLMKIPALSRSVFDAALRETCERLSATGSVVLDETTTHGTLERMLD